MPRSYTLDELAEVVRTQDLEIRRLRSTLYGIGVRLEHEPKNALRTIIREEIVKMLREDATPSRNDG